MTCSKCSLGFFLVAGKKRVNLRNTWTYSRQGIVSKFFGHHPEAVKEDELSYVIGKEAATQKKIEKVCPCMCMVIYRARVQMSQWRSLNRSLSQQYPALPLDESNSVHGCYASNSRMTKSFLPSMIQTISDAASSAVTRQQAVFCSLWVATPSWPEF